MGNKSVNLKTSIVFASIGMWALAQPRWSCNAGSMNQKEDWQGRGKRRKPRIK